MSQYPYTPWVVGGALAITLGFIAWTVYRVWKHRYIPWLPLPGYYPGSKWFSSTPIDPSLVTEALQIAESLLIARTRWTAANLALVGHAVSVYVTDSESWVDLWGRKVAGLQIEHTLVVGPSLAALCHELAHLCEKMLDNEVDGAHATWATDGIEAAVADFDAWLSKRRAVSRVAAGIATLPLLMTKPTCRYNKESA